MDTKALTELERFEAHMKSLEHWRDCPSAFERSKAVPDMYYNNRLDDTWKGWQARASAPPASAEPVAWMKRTNVSADWDAYDFSANPEPGFDVPLYAAPTWPREAEDRVNHLLGQLAAKELECQRLRETPPFTAPPAQDAAPQEPAPASQAGVREAPDDSDRLMPCPFCRGEAEFVLIENEADPCFGGVVASCLDCGASSRVFFPLKDDVKPLLMEAWNKRPFTAQPTQAQPIDQAGAREAQVRTVVMTEAVDPITSERSFKPQVATSTAPLVAECKRLINDVRFYSIQHDGTLEKRAEAVRLANEAVDRLAAAQPTQAQEKDAAREALQVADDLERWGANLAKGEMLKLSGSHAVEMGRRVRAAIDSAIAASTAAQPKGST
jgi:Restriction alleviation protein Lar